MPLSASEISADGVTSVEVPGYATVRTNPFTGAPEALGVVGAGYRPLQNEEHCDFLNHLADASGAIFDTAGSLRGGRQVFVTMCLPETVLVGGVDELDLNIAALNSHDGNSAFRVLLTPVRVVCANTQAAALRNHVASVSIRHTSRREGRGHRRTGRPRADVRVRRRVPGRGRAPAGHGHDRRRVRRPDRRGVSTARARRPRAHPHVGEPAPRHSGTPVPPRPHPSAPSRAPHGPATRPSWSTSTTTPPPAQRARTP